MTKIASHSVASPVPQASFSLANKSLEDCVQLFGERRLLRVVFAATRDEALYRGPWDRLISFLVRDRKQERLSCLVDAIGDDMYLPVISPAEPRGAGFQRTLARIFGSGETDIGCIAGRTMKLVSFCPAAKCDTIRLENVQRPVFVPFAPRLRIGSSQWALPISRSGLKAGQRTPEDASRVFHAVLSLSAPECRKYWNEFFITKGHAKSMPGRNAIVNWVKNPDYNVREYIQEFEALEKRNLKGAKSLLWVLDSDIWRTHKSTAINVNP